jgi:oxygen-independent coproporphyrinogen-3 oxidase
MLAEQDSFGIYIHIPFCRSRCNYCHFVTRPWEEAVAERYVRAVLREMEAFFARFPPVVLADTIYFGGGTPSIVPAEHIEELLSACRQLARVMDECEITLEANPGTLTPDKVDAYRRMGINRVSMGAQSFNDAELDAIGRVHTADQVDASVALLRDHSIANINLDLMIGLPGQTRLRWNENLQRMVRIAPPHISVYMLDLDPHSPLYHSIARGRHRVPEDDDVADWYLQAIDHFAGAGYRQYEISNFAAPGRESRHNLKYWLRKPVLAFGVGSHSFDGSARYANDSNLSSYLVNVESQGSAVEWRRPVGMDEALEEALFLGLRLARGLDWDQISRTFGSARVAPFEPVIDEMSHQGLLRRADSTIQLTPRGMLLSNEIFQRFV